MDGGWGIWCGVSAWGPRTHSNDYDGGRARTLMTTMDRPSGRRPTVPSILRCWRVFATREDSGATRATRARYRTSRMPLRNKTCIPCMYLGDGFPVHERQVHAHEEDRRHEVHAHHPGHEQNQHVRVVAIVYCILSSPPRARPRRTWSRVDML